MTVSNYQKTATNEKLSKIKLLKIIMYILIIVLSLLIILFVWITQPLYSVAKINKSDIDLDKASLELHVRKLSEDFHPRNFANIENLNKSADYIKSEFEKTGGNVIEQTFKEGRNEYRNIIVKYGDETEERIIIGAHYDSCYDTPGADDNASGVAGLIELAKLFDKNKPKISVELVAYTLEEPPFFSTEQMGSYIHAKSLKDNNVNVRLMISLEMIGYFSDEENSQEFPFYPMKLMYPNKGNFISVVGNFSNINTVRNLKSLMAATNDLPVYSINAPASLPGIDFSDHKNYWSFGYDAVMITDTAFFRNKNYHTKKDIADTLNYEKMAKVVESTFESVNQLAGN